MTNNKFFNLSAITKRIQEILQPHIGKLFWIKAEISSGRERGGSFYCDLVETEETGKIIAKMNCSIWSSDLSRIRKQFKGHDLDLQLENGTVVGFQCTLQYSPQYGLSLKVVDADPAFALGELELKKREILDRLKKESLLEPNKRLFVPMLPQKIGLITSKGSAAYNDFLQTLTTSIFGFKIYVADAIVQGKQSEQSILSALNILEKLDVEIIIIIRGGGSKSDLYYLDNEAIARRIASYKMPVWTGIGHEIDKSILDYVSNRSFKTPTAVAEEILARFVEMKRHLEESKNRFQSTWSYRFDMDKKAINDARTGIKQGTRKLLDNIKRDLKNSANLLSRKVTERLTSEKTKISVSKKMLSTLPILLAKKMKDRFLVKMASYRNICTREISNKTKDLLIIKKRFRRDRYFQRIVKERANVHAKNSILNVADPKTSLKRGFSLAYKADGTLVKSINQLRLKDNLKTEVSDGLVLSTISKFERK
jgi:exodeoxyribonuclease VII large subunit